MTELLALVHIGDVNLNDGSGDGTDGIMESYAGVRIGTCVKDDAVSGEAHFMQLVDKGTFVVALVI